MDNSGWNITLKATDMCCWWKMQLRSQEKKRRTTYLLISLTVSKRTIFILLLHIVHLHFLNSSTSSSIPAMKKHFGCSRIQICTDSSSSSSEVNLWPMTARTDETHDARSRGDGNEGDFQTTADTLLMWISWWLTRPSFVHYTCSSRFPLSYLTKILRRISAAFILSPRGSLTMIRLFNNGSEVSMFTWPRFYLG